MLRVQTPPSEPHAATKLACSGSSRSISTPLISSTTGSSSKGPLDPPRLLQQKPLLVALRQGPAPSGAIVQKAAKTALVKLFKARESEWHLGKEAASKAESVAKKIRAMSRDIQQNLLKAKAKSRYPDWLITVLDLPADSAREEQPSVGCGEHASDQASLDVESSQQRKHDEEFYFNQKSGRAYKVVRGETIWCDTMGAPKHPTGDPAEEQVATWADGSTWRVPGLLVCPPPLEIGSSGAASTKAAPGAQTKLFQDQRGDRKVIVKPSFRHGIKDIILWLETMKDGERKKTQVLCMNCKGISEAQEAQHR